MRKALYGQIQENYDANCTLTSLGPWDRKFLAFDFFKCAYSFIFNLTTLLVASYYIALYDLFVRRQYNVLQMSLSWL